MIDLTIKTLPDAIQVNGKEFPVHTDFRIWLKFCTEFDQWTKAGRTGEFDIRYLFKVEIPVLSAEDYHAIFDFAFPKAVIPHSESGGEQILFYDIDGDYIYSAFLQQYGIDLLSAELHWHKFKALLSGIGKPTMLYEIMGYRSYTGEKNKDMDTAYRKLKAAWMPPYEETEEDKIAEEEFNSFFG